VRPASECAFGFGKMSGLTESRRRAAWIRCLIYYGTGPLTRPNLLFSLVFKQLCPVETFVKAQRDMLESVDWDWSCYGDWSIPEADKWASGSRQSRGSRELLVGNWSGPRALGAWTGRGLCAPCGGRGYISGIVFFMYPYVFVADHNKHDALLIIACADGTRNSTINARRAVASHLPHAPITSSRFFGLIFVTKR